MTRKEEASGADSVIAFLSPLTWASCRLWEPPRHVFGGHTDSKERSLNIANIMVRQPMYSQALCRAKTKGRAKTEKHTPSPSSSSSAAAQPYRSIGRWDIR